MVRIHGTVGPNTLPWHQLLHFDPTANRFDPHPPPPAMHPGFAVTYTAGDVDTALAEVFQGGRIIRPVRAEQHVPDDLDAAAATSTPRPATHLADPRRRLPRPEHRSTARLSTMGSRHRRPPPRRRRRPPHLIDDRRRRAVLFLPAADSFPPSPELSLPLSDPGLVGVLTAAHRIGYATT